MKRLLVAATMVVGGLLLSAPEASATATFAGSGSGLAASASFTITGTTLTILLTNTDAASSGMSSAQVLTGLYFNVGTTTFTPVSASVHTGSIAQASQCNPGPCGASTVDVGGEWSYYGNNGADIESSISGVQKHVISSSGYIDGAASTGNFNGVDLDGPAALNGSNFGIVPLGFVDNSGNGGLDGDPLIKGAVTFVLEIPTGLTEAMISSVKFAYGTADSDTRFYGSTTTTGGSTSGSVPEPQLLVLFGAGLAVAAYRLRRRRVSNS